MPPRKDPNKPKGRTSAYAFFVQDRREQCKEKGEQVEFAVFSRACADLWKDITPSKKAKYIELAEKDKKRYTTEMAAYQPSDDKRGKQGKKRKRKDPNMPKRSMSGFMFFSQDKRPKLREQTPSATVGELAKQLGAAWKIMTEEQKKPYEDKAKKDRARYDAEMEQYRKGEYHREDEEDEEEEEDDDED